MHHLIVFTSPDEIPGEGEAINSLFQAGLECLHLRKPTFNENEFISLIEKINIEYRGKIMIHSFHDLAWGYGLKGIHFTNQFICSVPDETITGIINKSHVSGKLVSTSVHSFDEILKINFHFDYVFMGPLFDSISKPGYQGKLTLQECEKFFSAHNPACKIIALGGITDQNISPVFQSGFNGAAVLGYIWHNTDHVTAINNPDAKPHDNLKKISQKFYKLSLITQRGSVQPVAKKSS